MKQIIPIFVLFVASFNLCLGQKPWEPTPRPEQSWMDKHNSFVENSAINGDQITAVFIGSSLMEFWGTNGLEIWKSKYEPLGAVNYGIGGDRTEHMLWRIQNGELDGLNPKVIVVYIGSNNVAVGHSIDDIDQAVRTTVAVIREKLPSTPILYTTIFPREDLQPVPDSWTKIRSITEKTLQLNDNNMVNILDIFNDFVESWGHIKKPLFVSDNLHFSPAGYGQWDASMDSTFFRLFNRG